MTAPPPAVAPSPTQSLQFTAEERFKLDVLGYVVIEGFVPMAHVIELREALYAMEERFHASGERPRRPAFLSVTTHHNFRVDNLPHLAPCFHRYLSDQRLVGRVVEMIGHEVRLEQSDAHIRRPEAAKPDRYGFHRANRLGLGGVGPNGLYHFPLRQGPDQPQRPRPRRRRHRGDRRVAQAAAAPGPGHDRRRRP